MFFNSTIKTLACRPATWRGRQRGTGNWGPGGERDKAGVLWGGAGSRGVLAEPASSTSRDRGSPGMDGGGCRFGDEAS